MIKGFESGLDNLGKIGIGERISGKYITILKHLIKGKSHILYYKQLHFIKAKITV